MRKVIGFTCVAILICILGGMIWIDRDGLLGALFAALVAVSFVVMIIKGIEWGFSKDIYK